MNSLFNERHTTHKCLRCSHVWTGRECFKGSQELPKRCAGCRSPLWNKPRQKNHGKPINALALLEEWREAGLEISLHVGARYKYTDEARRVSLYVRRSGEGLACWWGTTIQECVLACADEVRSGMVSASQK